MKTLSLLMASAVLVLAPSAYANGDLTRANVQTVVLEMGTNSSGGMYLKPGQLKFKTGQAYNLVLKNVDKIKHEVEAPEFVEKIFTRKVEIEDSKGALVAEIKGNINEVEVGPGQAVQWFFVALQPGTDIEIVCALPGHKEAGMHGLITIE